MPILLNVLSGSDPKVVEQGCLCVSRIIESFKHRPDKLEVLIEPAMLKAMLRLLSPGTTNLIGPHIHTQFLRVLTIVSKASPHLSVELLKMDVVDTLYQILTGVSPPEDLENTTVKMDSVLVMQALIHRPREQVFETLNVVCELLPAVPGRDDSDAGGLSAYLESGLAIGAKSNKAKELVESRRSLLMGCKKELKRFAMILLPTLTDAYSSTVNLSVRQRVLVAQLKMLHSIEPAVAEDALRAVPYASFLAAILSQKDHPSLVSLALRCAELLFQRLENIYQHQFHREGVISEIIKLAEEPLSSEPPADHGSASHDAAVRRPSRPSHSTLLARKDDSPEVDGGDGGADDDDDDDGGDFDGVDEMDGQEDDDTDENESDSESSSSFSGRRAVANVNDAVNDIAIREARAFLNIYEASDGKKMRDRALEILTKLQTLAADIKACYLGDAGNDGFGLFKELASYFDGDALESITSSELLKSGIVQVLLDVFGDFKCK